MAREGASDRGGRPPRPPRQLAPAAQAYWRALVPELWAKGDLTTIRRALLARYCEVAVVADQAMVGLGPGVIIRGRRDHVVANPAWRIYRDAVELQVKLARQLGLSDTP